MTLRCGDVVLIRMVLLDTVDEDFVAAPITSRARHSDWDFPIEKWRAAGLNVSS